MSECFDILDILRESGAKQRHVIDILHRIQARFGHVPPAVLPAVARHVRISESELYGLLTFYRAFTLQPQGRHKASVCLGTACHVRGGEAVAEVLSQALGMKRGESTPDGRFSLETVNCLGCCAIGPVFVLDGTIHARVTPRKARRLADSLLSGGRRKGHD
jgi:NADH-quinone oxidoreductase subunit E